MNDTLITILFLSISGSILALILFAGKPFLKNRVSKAFSYYIWLLVLLRLLVPIAAPVNVMGSLSDIEQTSRNNTVAGQTVVPAGNRTVQTKAKATAPTKIHAVPSEPQNHKIVGIQWSYIGGFVKNNLLWIWLTGSAVSLGWFMIAYTFFSWYIRRSCVVPDSGDLEVFEQMSENRHVRMVCSSYVDTPMFIGVLRPVIVLPQRAYVKNSMDKELRNILHHELTHYRRKDVLYKWLVVAVTSFHWFNPLMILIRKEIGRACELSCDEAVISGMSADEKQYYGNTLLALSANRKLPTGILATTLCEEKKELKERLISIMKYKKKSTCAVILTFVLTLLLTGCATALGVPRSSGGEATSQKAATSETADSNKASNSPISKDMPENNRRASAVYYVPDLSAYPNLDKTIDLPPYEVHVYADGSIVDFNFVTKAVPFKDMIQKIDKSLKADGFAPATEEQYADLINGLDGFKQGKAENTYIKPKNNNDDVTPYAIQIIDGGMDNNNLPIIIVKMAGGNAYYSEISNNSGNEAMTEDDTRASAVFYIPDLSAYPNLDDVINLPPYEIDSNGNIVDFQFVTKDVPFKEMIQKIDKKLKADGFAPATEKQYTELTNSLNEFKQGKAENTYIKKKIII